MGPYRSQPARPGSGESAGEDAGGDETARVRAAGSEVTTKMPAPEQGAPSSSSSSSVHPLELGATVACTRAGVAGASSVEIIERRRKADNGPWQYCESCYIHRSSSSSHWCLSVSQFFSRVVLCGLSLLQMSTTLASTAASTNGLRKIVWSSSSLRLCHQACCLVGQACHTHVARRILAPSGVRRGT